MTGPLNGFTVLEMAGIGPGPFCAMMLADMGAEVIRVDRKTPGFLGGGGTIVDRGRRTIALDIKKPGAIDIVLRLAEKSDAVLEGFRPGVMERLGLGPDICLERNPRLVYGRMTGWGQTGPLATAAGHDLNYIAITGVLNAMGYADRPPTPPLHLVGDIGGGGMMLAFGIVCALLETSRTGKGQVVDAAICDGVSALATAYHGMRASGKWVDKRQSNMLDGGAHFYGCYACADGRFISIGSIEPQFYSLLLKCCGIDDPDFGMQWDRAQWPALRDKLANLFLTKTRAEWCDVLEGSDVCFAPVLDFEEAISYPHNAARNSFVETDGIVHPAPVPRFSRTPGAAGAIPKTGQHTQELLVGLGMSKAEIKTLRANGTIA
jgi:alpha-methylacyl-CoA racemase